MVGTPPARPSLHFLADRAMSIASFFTKRPREDDGGTAAAAPPTSAPRTLTPEATSLLEHLTEPGWKAALEKEFVKPYFVDLAAKVAAEREKKKVYPPKDQVFSALNLTPLDDVRVVILGQDPYHGAGQAHGLSFSVPPGIAVPPSLKNIYTELEADMPGFKRPSHGNLEAWARRGVLLLNATLTVRASEANSHEKYGWQTFTDAVVRVLSQRKEPLVFLLWGGFAQRKGKVIGRLHHKVIETAHPSPLSVTKWRGCKCFSKANEWLVGKGKDPVDWHLS